MSVTFTINNVEPYGVVCTDWDMIEIAGSTIFVPKEGFVERKLNLSSVKEQLLNDFFDIGDYLYSNFINSFQPLWGSALEAKRAKFEDRSTWSKEAVFALLNDNNFSFFSDPDKKKVLLGKLLSFMSKYGYSSGSDREDMCVASAQRIWLREIEKLYAESGRSFNVPSTFFIKGAFHIIVEIFATYMACCKQDEYAEKFIAVYSEELYNDYLVFAAELTLTQKYSYQTRSFNFSYTVFGVIDFITLLLMLINSNATEQKVISCAYCGKSILVDNSRSIYCSPTCRNRANVKRNYEKRKVKDAAI